MNVAVFSSSPLLPQSLVCNWPAVGHTLVLAVCRSGHLCSICSAVWSSRPQSQIGEGASFIFLNMWALSRLWPVCSLMTTSYCHRSRKWKSSLSVRCPRAALMRVLFSWKVALIPVPISWEQPPTTRNKSQISQGKNPGQAQKLEG